jgi:hypothetical protein
MNLNPGSRYLIKNCSPGYSIVCTKSTYIGIPYSIVHKVIFS